MTFHPSTAVSVVLMLILAAAVVAGYHVSRRPSAHRSAPAAHVARPHAWIPAAALMSGLVLVLAVLFVAAFTAGS